MTDIDIAGIPPSWTKCKFGDLVRVRNGYAFKSSDFIKSNPGPTDIPLVRQSQLKGDEVDLSVAVYLPARFLQEFPNFVLKNGDIIIGMSGSIGHICSYKNEAPALQNQRTGKIELLSAEAIEARFFGLYLSSVEGALIRLSKGMGVQNISSRDIENLPLHLPPLSEQRRIVAKIEELFSELDNGVESLLRARSQLNLYRLVVLNRAMQDSSGATFPTRLLSELIGPINQGWSPKCELNRQPEDAEWAIIKTTAIQPMRYDGMECKPLPQGLRPRPNIEIHDGDLLMTRKGPRPRTGVVCYVKKARPRSMLCDTVYRFRCNEELVLPEYLELALNSPRVVQEINSRKSGISESGISLNHGKLESIPVPAPSNKDHQGSIVSQVREHLSLIDNVEAVIADQIDHAEALRQAILRRAFGGDLVSQDPMDEPASLLLERIRAENEDNGNSRKKNNKNNGKKEAA